MKSSSHQPLRYAARWVCKTCGEPLVLHHVNVNGDPHDHQVINIRVVCPKENTAAHGVRQARKEGA